jgi:hypothetical protein
MKGIIQKREVSLFDLESIPQGPNFAKDAAKKILQHDELYSVYKGMVDFREKEMEQGLFQKDFDFLFSDTKEQNKCCRVGQIKLFKGNFQTFEKKKQELLLRFYQNSESIGQSRPMIDLHMLMISTVPSADEVFEGKTLTTKHKDEFWFWIPATETAREHLAFFLNGFSLQQEVKELTFELEIQGELGLWLEEVFKRNFLKTKTTLTKNKQKGAIAILKFRAGALNSRKAMVSPFLPQLVS